MLVPAVGMGELGRFRGGLHLLVTGNVCLRRAIAVGKSADPEHIYTTAKNRKYKAEDQRCAQGALEVHIGGVLNPFINTDQFALII